jgi:hypothetical protein
MRMHYSIGFGFNREWFSVENSLASGAKSLEHPTRTYDNLINPFLVEETIKDIIGNEALGGWAAMQFLEDK